MTYGEVKNWVGFIREHPSKPNTELLADICEALNQRINELEREQAATSKALTELGNIHP